MVVISLPHASLLHPVALRRPPGPQQSSFISAKQTRDGNPTLPAANVLSGVSPARRIPQPTTNRKPRLAFMQQELTFPIFLAFPTSPEPKTPLRTSATSAVYYCTSPKRGFCFWQAPAQPIFWETPLSTHAATMAAHLIAAKPPKIPLFPPPKTGFAA